MNVAILSSSVKVGSTRRLKDGLSARGHKVRVIAPDDLRIYVERGNPVLLHKGKPLKRPDAVIPRIATSRTFFGTALVAQFEQMGVFCLNSALAIAASRNKLRAIQRLSRHGIGIPETVFLSVRGDVASALDLVGGVPVIIKLLEGTQGVGVMLADTVEGATAILETLRKTGQDVLVQRFVAESRGRDVRALVVGGKAVAAVRRVAQGREFRSNVHRGAEAEAIELDPIYARTAERATQILGLQVAGVDMLEGADGPLVVEVNSSPSLAGMEKSTETDLVAPVIDLLEATVRLPQVDVVQRLTLQQGFGVTEFPLPPGLAGETIANAGLRDLGLQVLCVQREGELITGPRGSFELIAGDVLSVFGLLSAVNELLPQPPRRRRPKPPGDVSD